MIRAYLDNAKGQSVLLSRESDRPEFKGGASAGSFVANVASEPIFVGVPSTESAEGSRAFAAYNLYRKNVLTDEVEDLLQKTTDTAYVDNAWLELPAGSYQWGVSAVYEGNRGQVYFSEGFEGGAIPTGWSTINKAPAAGTPNMAEEWAVVDKSANYYNQVCYPFEGSYFARSTGGWPSGDGY
jgi:hypothetical protein